MSNLQADIDISRTQVRSDSPPRRRVLRRIDASDMLLLLDSMQDGQWFEIENKEVGRMLAKRCNVKRIQHGYPAIGYMAASGSFVIVKGLTNLNTIPEDVVKNMPEIRTGEMPKLRGPGPRTNPYVEAARRLQPGEWFAMPSAQYQKFASALSHARSRGSNVNVSARKMENGDFCVFCVPTGIEAPNA